VSVENSVFWANGASDWSVYINGSATAHSRYGTFGPAGDNAVRNVTGIPCDMTLNYWGAPDGPFGAGADISGSNVSYTPFLTEPPVESTAATDLGLPVGGTLIWDSLLGVVLQLTGKTEGAGLTGETAGVLRVNDTEHLDRVTPPEGLITGQLYTVWVSTPLRSNSGSGYLTFSLPFQEKQVALMRRAPDGSWDRVKSTWDRSRRLLTFSPDDLDLINGTFAVVPAGSGFLPSVFRLLLS